MSQLLSNDEWRLGHVPLERRVNVRRELQRLRRDPLEPLLKLIRKAKEETLLRDDVNAYEQSYYFYYLSLSRFLSASSLAWRCQWMKCWPRRRGGAFANSHHQKLAKQYHETFPYILYDLWNCLLHARILMDRTIHLSRMFLVREPLPSFTSFNDHKKFFQRNAERMIGHRNYGAHIRDNTDWFDIPIKLVRDKFLVHAGPKHIAQLAFPGSPRGFEIGLMLLVPSKPNDKQYLKELKHIWVSIPRLMDDIDGFLHWFADYGTRALSSGPRNETV